MYRIGSISKSFTGLALLALRDDGVLQLDDPLAKWIPEASGLVYPTRDSPRITLRQLAKHTSGLPRMGTFDFEATPTEKIVGESLAGSRSTARPARAGTTRTSGSACSGWPSVTRRSRRCTT